MPSTLSPFKLKKSDIEQFKTQGFIALKDVLPVEEIKKIEVIYDRLFSEKVGFADGRFFDLAGTDDNAAQLKMPQLLGPSNFSEELKNSIIFPILQVIAKQLLEIDPKIVLHVGDHAILKTAKKKT